MPQAATWHGSSGTWLSLNPVIPVTALSSFATGAYGDKQAGYANFGGGDRAGYWQGTAASWIDLHPAGAMTSQALGLDAFQQVGRAFIQGPGVSGYHAGLWNGSAATWVDLNPANGYSEAFGVHGGIQVGRALFGGPSYHAGLWRGSPQTWVDLNPSTGIGDAAAYSVHNGQQVGYVTIGGLSRASLWSGTAASWVNLHNALPSQFPVQFSSSVAHAIWHDAAWTQIVGTAYNSVIGRNEAMLWVAPTCYPNCDGSTSAPILNIADFVCFLNKYAAADLYANCDGSSVAPVLNIADFTCFLNRYAAGCP